MSGPIIRKYGFPNFEQIFGKKEPQHGVDVPETPAQAPSNDDKDGDKKPAERPEK